MPSFEETPDSAGSVTTRPRVGDPVDLAPFARLRWWSGAGGPSLGAYDLGPDSDGWLRPHRDPETGQWQVGLEWDEPRDVRQVVVHYAPGSPVPPGLQVQYWQQNWPTPAPERRPGARRGWIGRDDPWHGTWTTVRGEVRVEGDTCSFLFDPIDLAELGGRDAVARLEAAEGYLARHRRTLKVRLVSGGEAQPRIAKLEAYSGAQWQQGEIDAWFGIAEAAVADWSGHAKVYNGYVVAVQPLAVEPGDGIGEDGSWRCQVDGKPKGVRLRVRYIDVGPTSADRTIVTLRTRAHDVSFLVPDLDRGPIYVADYDLWIAWAGRGPSFEAFQAARSDLPRSIYDRVPDEPEHSLARALAEIPPLDVTQQESRSGLGRYVPLGVEAGRQEWALRYNGELFADKASLKLKGRDAARLIWPGHQLRFRFGGGDPPDYRERRDGTIQSLLEGWMPVIVSRWLDREIEYEQTAFAALLGGPMTQPEERRGDESVVAMLRFVIRNATPGRKRAQLWLAIAPQEALQVDRGTSPGQALLLARGRVVPAEPVARQWRIQAYEAACLRSVVDHGGRGRLEAVPHGEDAELSQAIATAALYTVDLEGGERHTLYLTVPFVSLTAEQEWRQAAALDFHAKLEEVTAYWRGYISSGGTIEVPEPEQVLADFHKAVRVHVAITADKDPVSGLIALPAATYDYGVCANEACWQITMLDQAGHHDRAETYLETYLATQGQSSLDGDFSSSEGVMQGLDFDAGVPSRSGFAYNLDPGFIMECLANHYRLTGDQAWLIRVAPKLVAACDFVIRERDRTKRSEPDGTPVREWGLLPAGHLEDNPEWRCWFAVNAHAYNGMRAIAQALADVGHLQAERLVRAAAAYREDIRRAVRRAMAGSPVVRLLDGTYVPHLPTRTAIRGREWGWFREAAYGPLHLLEGNVFDPDEPEMTWVLKDLEDNLFVSREWGRPVDLERHWFSHGGVTVQPNLMDLGVDYLRRGEVAHALRALYNNFGTLLYPDVRAFAEHPVVELGHGVGPFFKSSDESKALTWLRAHLLWEEGERLHLAMGTPRHWFAPGERFGVRGMATWFGPVTYRVQSGDADVTVEVELAPGRPPGELIVHLRLPGSPEIKAVTVNDRSHSDHDSSAETIHLVAPSGRLTIQATYGT